MNKPFSIIALSLLTTLFTTGCGSDDDNGNDNSSSLSSSSQYSTDDLQAFIDAQDLTNYYSYSEIISLLDQAITNVDSDGISFDDDLYTDYSDLDYTELNASSDSYTITEAGTYLLTGSINSTVTISLDDEDQDVRLILNGVDISSDDGPAILITAADDVEISVVDGTVNYIEDAASRDSDAEDYTGAIYSDCDLVINGSGNLQVTGNYNNGLITKDDLKLINLTLTVSAEDDGIIGKDSLSVYGANISVDAAGDALKSSKEDDLEKGFVYIESGTFDISSSDDGISAENLMVIYDGTFNLATTGKALKSETQIAIGGGSFTINSSDDALDSNQDLAIYDGDFTISTEGDSIKATETLEISGGNIDISTTVEGLEAQYLTINSGYITINSTDDAVNATSDYDDNTLTINGGLMVLTSTGDTVDVNGSAQINGGTLIANGPTSYESNATFDVDDGYDINAGTVFAFGNSNLVTTPSNSSDQASIVVNLNSFYSEDTWVYLKDASDQTIMSLYALNSFDHLILSHSDLTLEDTYTIEIGDSDGLDVTLHSAVTSTNY